MTSDPTGDAKKCRCYGGLFVGTQSAEVMGDYGAGPNHVLPTGGTGRYTGGLSVFTFLAIRTWMELDTSSPRNAKGLAEVVEDAVTVARVEGLEGHARAAELRLGKGSRKGEGSGEADQGSAKAKGVITATYSLNNRCLLIPCLVPWYRYTLRLMTPLLCSALLSKRPPYTELANSQLDPQLSGRRRCARGRATCASARSLIAWPVDLHPAH